MEFLELIKKRYSCRHISSIPIEKDKLEKIVIAGQMIYIMSGEIGLYEKYGFVKLGDYKTVYGSVDQLFVQTISDR